MAIIRIKRTTGSNLPTGLTFGEMAFIGATGGATASRLYIAGPQGVCVWIGAEILNSPTFWSGATAETTLPTVSAVESRITSRLSSGAVTSFNSQTGAVQGVSAMGATGSTWKKLTVSFTNSDSTRGATGFVNLLGVTWMDSSATNTTVGGLASGSSINGNSIIEILEKMLFTFQSASISSLDVQSFTSGTLELGQTAGSSGNRTVTSSATNTSNIDTNGYSIIYSHTSTSAPAGNGSGTLMGATAYAASKANINLSTDVRAITNGANFTFTARVSDYNAWVAYGSPLPTSLGDTASTTESATWYSKMYWGYTTGSSITARSNLVGEQSRFVSQTAAAYTFNSANKITWNPPTGDQSYLYILIHNDYWSTEPTWWDADSGLGFGFGPQASPATISLTNDQGYATTYRVFRSDQTFNSAKGLYVT